VQIEASAQAIIEGLRLTDWKLRAAAKLLGLSPTKLRGDLKEYFEDALRSHAGDLQATARALDIPLAVMERKSEDLGIGDASKGAP
jgi:hypothetical protein